MDGTIRALFLVSTFFGGVVTGLAGFAMGLVVSGVWLHILTPIQTAARSSVTACWCKATASGNCGTP